ncbi:cytochrome c oxidase assembly protein COX16 homolog, mitochondrial isoform 2-T2 [Guaruba guarouba]
MERLRKLWRGRTMTFGVPLLLYLIGGSFGLREFAQIRYDVHKLHGKKLNKTDLNNWENIRGPRLGEDSRSVQKQQREALRLKTQ